MKCTFCSNTKVLFQTIVEPFFTVCPKCAMIQGLYQLEKVEDYCGKEQLEETSSSTLQPPLPLVWDTGDEEESPSSTPPS